MGTKVMLSADFLGADTYQRGRIAVSLSSRQWGKVEGVTTTWVKEFNMYLGIDIPALVAEDLKVALHHAGMSHAACTAVICPDGMGNCVYVPGFAHKQLNQQRFG